ncbi:GNAT family N-acetyltransferase [Micromonospora inyonensis]|uniref:GNAT family N-acetyltransferase n=1 Tax=Micromonospora inyonensis TaxID=47866 RepID=UPI00159F104F|nr:GNAT family N-acetyltransferase [Micromonospora inyonensis]
MAPDTHLVQAYSRADLPRMTRLVLREPMSAESVSRLLDQAPSTKSVVVEDVFGGHTALPASAARILRMPVMVRPAGTVPAAADETVRIVEVKHPDELVVAERIIVEGFPVSALLPWRRGEALPPHLLRVSHWKVWLAYRQGEPVAAGYTYDDGRAVGLYWLVTSPEHRSAGLARALLTRAVRAYPDRPFTLVATDAGLSLYKSLDFRSVATATWYMRSPVSDG